MSRAQGTFTVDIHPLSPAPAEGLGRFSINKTIHGDLEQAQPGTLRASHLGDLSAAGRTLGAGTLWPRRPTTEASPWARPPSRRRGWGAPASPVHEL